MLTFQLYKPFSQTTFYGMFKLALSQQSLTSYFLGGLPSFVASTALEQVGIPGSKEYPVYVDFLALVNHPY